MVKIAPRAKPLPKSVIAKAKPPTLIRSKGTRLQFLDLPEEVFPLIAESLVPAWQKITDTIGQLEDPGSPSLKSLSSFNQTCKAMHKLTLPILWRSVTCSSTYRWERVGRHIDKLVNSIWCLTDHGTAVAKTSATKLAKRFPSANIATAHVLSTPNGDLSISYLHLVAPEHNRDAWLWTCAQLPPIAITKVFALCPNEATQLPRWLKSYPVKEWEVQYERPTARLRFPAKLFDLPIQNTKCSVSIAWDCNDPREGKTLLADFQKNIPLYPEPPTKLIWTQLVLKVQMIKSVTFAHKTSTDGLMQVMGYWGIERFPRAAVTFEILDKKTKDKIGWTHWQ